jgi:hypothetical protein
MVLSKRIEERVINMETAERIMMSVERQHAAAQQSYNASQTLICTSNSAHKLLLQANLRWIKYKATGQVKWRCELLRDHAGTDIIWCFKRTNAARPLEARCVFKFQSA